MQSNSKKSSFNFSLLGRVLLFVKPYRAVFYGSILLAILMAFFAPVRPYLIQLTVDEVTGKHPHIPQWVHWFTGNSALQSITGFIIAVTIFQIIFLLIETIVRFLFTFLTAWLGQHVVKDLRVTVYNKILHLNLTQFDKTPIGTLTTRTINDIESINDIFSDGLIPILADLLTILITLATMFWIDWRLTLVALIPFPILIIATYYFKEAVNKSFIRVRNAVAALNAFVQEHITGMQVVQSFAVEDKEFEKFKHINREHRNANIKAIFAYSVFFPIVEIVLALSSALIIWWVANRAIAFTGGTPVNFSGKIVSFVLFMNQIFRPLRVIADKFNVLQMGMVAAERVFKVLDNTDVTQNTGKHAPDTIQGKIDFKHVWFAYIDEQYVLKDIDFSINAGETVAIVGHTGSGKTSIASLMNRLYHIQKGSILIDDVKIEDYSTEALRKHIGVVLQDVFLFSGSIIDNITLHNPAITREQVINAAKMMDVHDFIMRLPGGYDFDVRERGNTLSLGQRQIFSFIRALLYNPAVLILDEATSSIDSESEQLIQKAIDTLIAGRTSIIIAHRLSTIRKAHKIIVLDKGVIKEIGTHEELLNNGGFYARLYEMQFEKHTHSIVTSNGM
ncbi:ABC transporter ATP-binding protein [Hydrotalea sandarakina]|jgi:ATP-binding cassette subfamily B protein|uniref:ATP-binding cassette subfamily B protein n=1 Tax=Hydrotalea sandarakina TaxID=1004304 RepID=A0A2W7RMF2_9BACT|nr:ABC transporter ATP-binding protein [Hydrotalea sandarakina]PZX61441.1 ATP-binding cassette subfamily B protein [Hydrotalea sandarakina]